MNDTGVLIPALKWRDEKLWILDQKQLPKHENYLPCSNFREVVALIRDLGVRGAPAIGIAGAYAVALAVREFENLPNSLTQLKGAAEKIRLARPTAVNLAWAVDQVLRSIVGKDGLVPRPFEVALDVSHRIHKEDIDGNFRMSEFGAQHLQTTKSVLTYCNTGDLATGGIGTALGVIGKAYQQGKISHVFTCETRPVLQGLRLTVYELNRRKIPYTAICDNQVGSLFRDRKIGAVIVGADRIARNGDAANKVGTYTLAALAKHHDVPFFIAAPKSTFDLNIRDGSEIPVEQRTGEEIFQALGDNRPSFTITFANPAFDVTPAGYISAIFTEHGVIQPPNESTIKQCLIRQ